MSTTPAPTIPTDGLGTPGTPEQPGAGEGRHGSRAEGLFVTVVLLCMTALPVAEALARKLFHADLAGAAVYVQHGTLWVGFLGALLATGQGKHLGLSVAEMLPEGRPRLWARLFSGMVTTAVLALLCYAAFELVKADKVRQDVLSGGIPEWWSEVVMPVVFAAMALRTAWLMPLGWRGRALALAAIPIAFSIGLAANHPDPFVWPVILLLLLSFLVGAPVFVAMAGIAMLMFFSEGTPIAAVPTETFRLVASPTLPAIPLLTLAGYVLSEGGAAKRLVAAYQSVFGWMPGGLAIMAVSVCAIFTTFTGASGVTILALGGLVLPALLKEGYPEGFSLGLVTASGSLGLLFPPSLPVILYGVVAGVAIEKLFVAGLVPGLLMIVLVALYGVMVGVKAKVPRHAFDAKKALRDLWRAKWDLGLPVLVIFTVVSGFATITEAAGIASAYALFVEIVIFRELDPFRQLPRVMADAATLVGAVLILLGVALGLTSYFVDAQIPEALLGWVTAHIHSPELFLLALNALLLVLGSVLEIYSAIVVLAPLLVPLGNAFHIDPIHLGVVFLANLELGFLFPPMGLNLFLSAQRFQKPLPVLYKQALPFLAIMAFGVLVITYVPAVTIGVANLLPHTGAMGR
ncbi:MAG: TRAP transporter large permease [Deltaproteobacteria bacterium]